MGRSNKILYPRLKTEMGKRNMTIINLAAAIGRRSDVLSTKLRGKSPLHYEEAILIHKVFSDVDMEGLFKKD